MIEPYRFRQMNARRQTVIDAYAAIAAAGEVPYRTEIGARVGMSADTVGGYLNRARRDGLLPEIPAHLVPQAGRDAVAQKRAAVARADASVPVPTPVPKPTRKPRQRSRRHAFADDVCRHIMAEKHLGIWR